MNNPLEIIEKYAAKIDARIPLTTAERIEYDDAVAQYYDEQDIAAATGMDPRQPCDYPVYDPQR
jgi:chorismate mutase